MDGVPTVMMDRYTNVLAWNRLAHALLAPHLPFDAPQVLSDRPNSTRLLFEDGFTRALYMDWYSEALRAVSSLRFAFGRSLEDSQMRQLVEDLMDSSPEFRGLWEGQNIDYCVNGSKSFQHPLAGTFHLDFEVFHASDGLGDRLLTYTAVPGTAGEHALALLQASLTC